MALEQHKVIGPLHNFPEQEPDTGAAEKSVADTPAERSPAAGRRRAQGRRKALVDNWQQPDKPVVQVPGAAEQAYYPHLGVAWDQFWLALEAEALVASTHSASKRIDSTADERKKKE